MLRGRADTALPGTIVYIHLGGTLVAQDAWQWRSPFGRTYFHTDHLGTPLARSDFTGTVIERTRRQSFGQPLVGPLKDGPGYTGHMEDPGTGLVHMQQRYYDPTIASFLSVDPVGPLSDPSNHFGRYHYALNNPYRYTDPDGRVPLDTLVDVGYLIYDGGRFLGAAGAAGVGALTGNEALTSEGLAGMLATSGDLASSAASVVTPYASAPVARMSKEVAEAVSDAARTEKRYSSEKEALVDMAQNDRRTGITEVDMQAYKELNAGLPDPFTQDMVRGPEKHLRGAEHSRRDHGHVGPVDHIPIEVKPK